MRTSREIVKKKITFMFFFLMGVFASAMVFAQSDATMIIANPGENSANEIRISWHTATGVTGSFVEYTKKSDASWTNKQKVVGTYKLSTTWDGVLSRGASGTFTQNIQVNKYGAVLNNLDPDTEYMYRVGLNTLSDTRYFKTAGAKEYNIGWISDMHATANTWLGGRLTNAMNMVTRLVTAAGSGGVNFMFSSGDDVAYGAGYDYWKDVFSHAHYKNYMWVTTLGNHDAHTTAATDATDSHEFFRDTHNNPPNGYAGQEGCTYWFKYGDVLWVILNSMDLSAAQVPKAQAWLKQVIQNNPAQYIIVAEHYQYFNGVSGATNTEFTRWNQIFDECGVDLAVAGNNHIYLRTKSLYNGAVNTDPTRGTVYIQAPSSDNDRGQAMNETLSANSDKIVFRWTQGGPTVGGILMSVSESKIRVRLYDRNGVVLDDADIPTKRPAGSVLPKVSGVDAGSLTAVDVRKPMILNFNKKMDKTSVQNAISFLPAASVSYTWPSDYAVSIDISNLSYSTAYALTINGNVAKSTEGEFLDGAGNGTEKSNYVLNFTTAEPQKEANIFASELKVSPVATNGDVTFTYTLNAPASEVVIAVSNGDVFTINSGTGLVKGVNSVTKTLNSSTTEGNYTWTVKATGISANTNTGTTPIKFTDDSINEMKYYSPRGGLAMDKSMDSPFFGRIYISESLGGTTGGRTTQDGIYILNAALQDITGQGNTSYKGGTSWTYNGTSYDLTPYRVTVGPDGKVFIPKNHATEPGIWIMDPASPGGNFTTAFGNTTIYGRPIQSHLINGDLYVFDETYPAAYNMLCFNGFSPGRTVAHNSLAFTNPSSLITPNASTGNAIVSFAPDGKDGFWVGQLRTTESAANPSLIHINSSGTVDFNSFSNMAANKIGAISKGVVAFNKEKDLIAVGCSTLVKIYAVTWTSGVPSLVTATAPVSFNPTTGTNVDGLEFDPANNLYVISSSNEILAGFALPNANAAANTFTTTAPASNPVVVGGGISNAISGTYYIPKSGSQRGWGSLKEAFADINTIGVSGNVTLLITENISSADNVGLINNTNYAITIKSDGVKRTITFNKATDNAGPSGAFVIGCNSGLAFTDVSPAKNITLENLIITTAAAAHSASVPLVIVDACENITVKNCTIQRLSSAAASYGLQIRGLTSAATYPNAQHKMPVNVTIEGSEIINDANAAAVAFGISADVAASAGNGVKGLVIKNNIFRGSTRCFYLTNSLEGETIITGNEFRPKSTNGYVSTVIYASGGTSGNIYLIGNKFIEMKNGNTYDNGTEYGLKGVYITGGTATWHIDNNYFTGFDKTAGTAPTSLQAVFANASGVNINVRHNTFYLNKLTVVPEKNIANPTGADPSYCAINIRSAASSTIQNNLFVSDESVAYNFFIIGNAPPAANNNVYCLKYPACGQYASGTAPVSPRTVANVFFTNAAAGDLDLTGASVKDVNLGVPSLAGVLTDMYGTERWTTTHAGAHEAASFDPNVNVIDGAAVGGVLLVCFGNQITVSSDILIQSVKLFDLQGKMIDSKQNVLDNICQLNAPNAGIYIIETLTRNGRNIQKVAVSQ